MSSWHSFRNSFAYITQKVATWTAEVSALASIASIRLHAAYCAFTRGMVDRWIMRTSFPNIGPLLNLLKMLRIYLKLIPSLTGCFCSTSEHELLSLPCRLSGLGIVNSTILLTLNMMPLPNH